MKGTTLNFLKKCLAKRGHYSRYKNFILMLRNTFRQADPALFRLAEQEKAFIAANELQARFYTIKLLGEVFTDIDKYQSAVDELF